MLQVVLLLFVFIFVIGLAYYITKKLASLNTLRMQGKNMKIIETLQVGVSQVIHLVKIGDKIIIIGVSKDKITYLSEVDGESIDLLADDTSENTLTFEEQLRKMLPKKKK